jgi:transglutaminase-like putative cysteine protease
VIYTVRHQTTYEYESPVRFARCVLRLTPKRSATQTVLTSSVTVTPRPSETQEGVGAFGERTLTAVIDRPHTELIIRAQSRVDVHVGPVGDPADSRPWEAVRARAYETSSLEPEGPAVYLYPTRRTPNAPAITTYARQSFTPGRPIIEAAADLMQRIKWDFKYDPQATTVSTPAVEAFKARHGVCQDFAHIMISGVRGLGLSAAYVSGYLRTVPPPGKARLAGADATHAWVSIWCGDERGWIGFDPTNAIFAENDHIVLAVGRDYSDVAPIDGIILAPGEQTLDVAVDVIPDGEPMPIERPRRARAKAGAGSLA